MGLHYFKLIHEILYGLGFQDSFLEKYTAVQSIIFMIHHDVKLKKCKGIEFYGKDGKLVEDYHLPGSEIQNSNHPSQIDTMRKGIVYTI